MQSPARGQELAGDDVTIMMYVVQKNSPEGEKLWLSRAKPTVIWGDRRHAMMFETRGFLEGSGSQPGHFVIEKAFVER